MKRNRYISNNTEEGRTIGLEYFRERGYLNPIIEKFHLGYNPDSAHWDAFTEYAKKNGYSEELLEQIGLSIKGSKGTQPSVPTTEMSPPDRVRPHPKPRQ